MKSLIFSFGIITLVVSCNSCDPLGGLKQCENDFVFSIPVTMSPALDTFHIGDTIHISMGFPVDMEELNSGEVYDMSDFPFNLEINTTWLDTVVATNASNDINYIIQKGELELRPITIGDRAFIGLINEDGRFSLHLDIVPNKAGLLIMGFTANTDFYFSYDLDESCIGEQFKFLFDLNNKSDNNYELLEYSLDDYYFNVDKEYFDEFGGYVFWIEE